MMEVIYYARWTVGILCLVCFGVAAVQNLRIIHNAWFREGRSSLIPVVGGIIGMLGWVIVPLPQFIWFAWIPLLLDIGCVPALAIGLIQAYSDTKKDGGSEESG